MRVFKNKYIFLSIEVFINREKRILETKYYIKPTNLPLQPSKTCLQVGCVQHGSLGKHGEQQGGVEYRVPPGLERKILTAGIPFTANKRTI